MRAVAAVGAVLGCWAAFVLDVSIAGCLAVAAGLLVDQVYAALRLAPAASVGEAAEISARTGRAVEIGEVMA